MEIWSPDNNSIDNDMMTNTLEQLFDQLFIEIKEPGNAQAYQAVIKSMGQNQTLILSNIGKQEHSFWQNHLEKHCDQEIVILIEFFTLAEENISQWQFGSRSPVIDCAKILKKRKNKLSKELLAWIKSHSTNKFLPYGPL